MVRQAVLPAQALLPCLSLGMRLPIIHSKACHHGVTRHRSQYIGSVRSVAVLRMNCVAALAGDALGQQTQGWRRVRPVDRPTKSVV